MAATLQDLACWYSNASEPARLMLATQGLPAQISASVFGMVAVYYFSLDVSFELRPRGRRPRGAFFRVGHTRIGAAAWTPGVARPWCLVRAPRGKGSARTRSLEHTSGQGHRAQHCGEIVGRQETRGIVRPRSVGEPRGIFGAPAGVVGQQSWPKPAFAEPRKIISAPLS